MKKYLSVASLMIAMTLGISGDVHAAKHCTKGKPCGNACISKDDVCHISSGTARRSSKSENGVATESTRGMAKSKICKKGKPCGNSCISLKATCHE